MSWLLSRFGLCLLAVAVVRSSLWQLQATLDPGCPNSTTRESFVHIQARNASSTVHFLVAASATFPTPSIFIIHSDNASSQLKVNWTKLLSKNVGGAISITSATASYGMAFVTLTELNDSAIALKNYTLANFRWALVHLDEVPSNTSGILEVRFRAAVSNYHNMFAKKGYFDIKFTVSAQDRRGEALPHLVYIAGLSIQVEVVLVHLRTQFPESRFALVAAFMSNQTVRPGYDFRDSTDSSVNDEVTPGVFEKTDIFLGERVNMLGRRRSPFILHGPPAFVRWKPVCYAEPASTLKSSRMMTSSTRFNPAASQRKLVKASLAFAIYGYRWRQNFALKSVPGVIYPIGMQLQILTFGEASEGSYRTTNYTSWTTVFSLGSPPEEVFSTSLLVFMVVVFSVLLGVSALGLIYIAVVLFRRYRSFQPLILAHASSIESVTV